MSTENEHLAPHVGLSFVDAAQPVASALQLAPEKYLPQLDGLDLGHDQKVELLQALWSIMSRFAEIGFSGKNCGQLTAIFNEAALAESGIGTILLADNSATTLTIEGSGKAVSP